jgi:hypothetical protein
LSQYVNIHPVKLLKNIRKQLLFIQRLSFGRAEKRATRARLNLGQKFKQIEIWSFTILQFSLCLVVLLLRATAADSQLIVIEF